MRKTSNEQVAMQKRLWWQLKKFRALPKLTDAEAAAGVAAFLARGGTVTVCPTAFAAPVNNGDGIVPPAPPKRRKA